MKKFAFLSIIALASCSLGAHAQSEIYPSHFDLNEVTLLDSPFKTAMDTNNRLLLQYDVDRLLTPYVRQSGLGATTDTQNRYYKWETNHPSFDNWGNSSFNLDGHVGGHYLSALALAYAASSDETVKKAMKERMEYMLEVMKDCQDAFDNDTKGLYGFIGGQPINGVWRTLFNGTINDFRNKGGWVPFYCQHKILAGLRDAWLYGDSEMAKEMFRKLSDWSVNVVAKLSDADMETMLNTEHGGMNESMLDAYQIFGDAKYLTAAKRYSHKTMLNGMQTLNKTFLDGRHANTQVPKYIGFERIYEQDNTAAAYKTAADNFWADVAQNRTVCIGGNSVNEHFLSVGNSNRYIDQLDGPESCNTNNMLKLSEMMSDRTRDSRYADFYEYAMWNHILSTQDPQTGGYVYFTTLRPQGYRIYSQVNKGMWCCVGTGMENHSKYGHFIYTRDGNKTLYVNLFTASKLQSDDFVVTQETAYPYEQQSKLTISKAGSYTVAIRKPQWTTADYSVAVNGEKAMESQKNGYVLVNRTWSEGDVITVNIPMTLRYMECPNYTDYIAFAYGPILLGAQTTATSSEDAAATGLVYEKLQNEYAGEGRMDHAPGSMATGKNLTSSPLLIGKRADVLTRVKVKDLSKLSFEIDASRPEATTYVWDKLELRPFYSIHHARYMCYWYQQTADVYANSDMAKSEAVAEELKARTVDFVAPGEQQSEAGHEYNYSSESTVGNYNSETYRDARQNGYIQYSLFNPDGIKDSLSIMCRFTTADKGRMATLTVDGVKIADITIPASVKNADANGFYNIEYAIPENLAVDASGNAKSKFVVRLTASATTLCPGLYYMRLMRGYDETAGNYRFVASEWTTGDTWRLKAENIKYDNEKNVISVTAPGANNVCLMLDYGKTDYSINKDQIYLVVKGTNLSTASGASYLWWLNGANYGTQVVPDIVKTVSEDGKDYQIIAWDMTKSGLYTNFSGEKPSVCVGQTIFGLTSTDAAGKSDIHLITFVKDVEALVSGISVVETEKSPTASSYSISGIKVENPSDGIYIINGKKVVK